MVSSVAGSERSRDRTNPAGHLQHSAAIRQLDCLGHHLVAEVVEKQDVLVDCVELLQAFKGCEE